MAPTLILRTEPTHPLFGCRFDFEDEVNPSHVWLRELEYGLDGNTNSVSGPHISDSSLSISSLSTRLVPPPPARPVPSPPATSASPAAPPHPVARTSPPPPDPRPSSPPQLDPRTAELGAAGSTRGTGPPPLRASSAAAAAGLGRHGRAPPAGELRRHGRTPPEGASRRGRRGRAVRVGGGGGGGLRGRRRRAAWHEAVEAAGCAA